MPALLVKRKARIRLAGVFLLVIGPILISRISIAEDHFPRKPIKVVVPFGAGGGSDTFVRVLCQGIREAQLSDYQLTVINVPGAGGTIGSRRVRNARADGYTLLNLHEGMLTAKYSGNVSYGPEAFEPVIGTGRVGMVLTVSETSPISDLKELLNRIVNAPETLRFAANLGAPSHFSGLLLESETEGGQFRFVQVGGGAKRFSALVGGHADVSVFSVSEFLQFKHSGLKGLALLSAVRSEAIPEVPTALELGVPLLFNNTQFWWIPKGTDSARINWIADLLEKAMTLPSVQDRLAAMHIEPIVLRDEELAETLTSKEKAMASLPIRRPIRVPAFGPGLLALLGLLVGLNYFCSRSVRSNSVVPVNGFETSFKSRTVIVRGAIILIYLILLGYRLLPFAWLTMIFVTTLGLSLSERPRIQFPWMLAVGCLMGFGTSWIFGEWLQIDLPQP